MNCRMDIKGNPAVNLKKMTWGSPQISILDPSGLVWILRGTPPQIKTKWRGVPPKIHTDPLSKHAAWPAAEKRGDERAAPLS